MATDVTTLQTRLTEAEQAYHSLQMGASQVEIQKGDRQVKFNLASVDKLRLYIGELKSQLVAAGALSASESGRRRPLNVVFGS